MFTCTLLLHIYGARRLYKIAQKLDPPLASGSASEEALTATCQVRLGPCEGLFRIKGGA